MAIKPDTSTDEAVARVLPAAFLSEPRDDITAYKIDFAKSTIPAYRDLYACVLDNVLSPEECELLVKAAEATTDGAWERAQVNIGRGLQAEIDSVRRCGRIIYDSQPLANLVWNRIAQVPEVQEILRLENRPLVFGNGPLKRKEVWSLTRPNERMRFLKYQGGEYFRAHCDGTYETPDRKERSFYTMHLYLSAASEVGDARAKFVDDLLTSIAADDVNKNGDGVDKDGGGAAARVPAKGVTVGGATIFHAINMDPSKDIKVYPVIGRILLFQHRDLLHSGDDIVSGVKYTMRTDLMYAKER